MREAFVVVLLIASGAASRADEKVDFEVSAEAFAKEYKTDPKAFAAKYKGKAVEVTGTVWGTRVGWPDVLLNGYKEKPTELVGTVVTCAVPDKLRPQLRPLARGQQLTVRGTVLEGKHCVLDHCQFMKVGPTTAIPVTLAELDAEVAKDPKAARKKYDDVSVVVKVKVLSTKFKDKIVTWTVNDAGGTGAPERTAVANLFGDDKFVKELEAVKVGDIVILLADADCFSAPVSLSLAIPLVQPPVGVKLPGDKK